MPLVPPSPFARDDGGADQALAAALQAYAGGGPDQDVLIALASTRLLIPLVATLGESGAGPHGLEQEKSADVAVVLFQRPDGRRALLAFTSLDTMAAWNPAARPRPLTASDAAAAALGEGVDAILLDLSGPVRFAVETDELRHLAAGRALARTDVGYVWLDAGPDRSAEH